MTITNDTKVCHMHLKMRKLSLFNSLSIEEKDKLNKHLTYEERILLRLSSSASS
jgi:hypothetical protein